MILVTLQIGLVMDAVKQHTTVALDFALTYPNLLWKEESVITFTLYKVLTSIIFAPIFDA